MRPHARIWSPELLTKQDLKTDNKRLLKSPHKNSLPTLGKKKIKLSIDTKISRKNNIINSPYLEKNNRQLEGIISPRFLISKRQNKQVVPKMETVSKEKFSEQPNDLNFIRISKRLPSLKEGLTLYDKIFNYESPSKTWNPSPVPTDCNSPQSKSPKIDFSHYDVSNFLAPLRLRLLQKIHQNLKITDVSTPKTPQGNLKNYSFSKVSNDIIRNAKSDIEKLLESLV